MTLFFYIKLLQLGLAFFAIFSGVFVYQFKRHSAFHQLFLLVNMATGILIGSLALSELQALMLGTRNQVFYICEVISGSFIPILALHTISYLTKIRLNNYALGIGYSFGVLFAWGLYTFTKIEIIHSRIQRISDPILPLYGIFFITCLAVTTYLLFKVLQNKAITNSYRHQIIIMCACIVITALYVSIMGFGLPLIGFKEGFFLAQLGAALPVIGNFYAVLKYQAFEIKTANDFDVIESDLLQTQREKETVAAEKSHLQRLNSTILHEIKNFNSGVAKTIPKIIATDQIASPNVALLGSIALQSNHMFQLAQNYFLKELVGADAITLKIAPCKLAELISNIESSTAFSLNVSRIQLALDIDPRLILHIDIELMNLLFKNLISNAIAVSHDDQTIRISSHIDGENLVISIIDEGFGMEEGLLIKLNHFFKFKVEKQIFPLGPGFKTGLGLQICKYIADVHGFFIHITNTEDKGACVMLRFPPHLFAAD